jgi:3'-5' exoribonuclease
MKTAFVSELEPNQVITTTFLVQSKEIRQKRTGEPFLSLLLSDRTGDVDAKMWDNVAEVMNTFDRDDFVKVKGLVQIFQNRRQFTIHKMRRLDEAEVSFADYFPASKRDPEEMWGELRGIVASMENPHLRELLNALLDDGEIARRYKVAPAAKAIHHAYLSGLIEHVLSLCALARMVAAHYPDVDLDLLLTGVILHDIGKIYELSYDRGFGYTSEGQLLGHMMIALRMIGEKLGAVPDFPQPLRSLVEHMIVSHHGQLEFGSPKVPLFQEALLLHYLDDLDSKMDCMRAAVERDRQVDGCFTSYISSMNRVVLKKARFLDPAPVPQQRPLKPPSPPSPAAAPVPPAPAASAAPAAALHPLFASRSTSPFADKLMEALKPGEPGSHE